MRIMYPSENHVLIASNANEYEFPNNTLAEFSNLFPLQEQISQKVYVCIKQIFVSRRIKAGEHSPAFIRVQLKQLTSNPFQKRGDRTLATFTYEGGDKDIRGDYQHVEFDSESYFELRNIPVTQLSVHLTDQLNNTVQFEDGLPTLVHLKLSSMNTSQEFSLHCMSHSPQEISMYPDNSLSKFHIRLPTEMTLRGWEVAVTGVGIPPQGDYDNTISLRVRVAQIYKRQNTTRLMYEVGMRARVRLLYTILPILRERGLTDKQIIGKVFGREKKDDRQRRHIREGLEFLQTAMRRKRQTIDSDGQESSSSTQLENQLFKRMKEHGETTEEALRALASAGRLHDDMEDFRFANTVDDDGDIEIDYDAAKGMLDLDEDPVAAAGADAAVEREEDEDVADPLTVALEDLEGLDANVDPAFDKIFTWDMNNFTTTRAILTQISNDISADPQLATTLRLHTSAENPGDWAFVVYGATQHNITYRLDFSYNMLRLLGETYNEPEKWVFPWTGLSFTKSASLWRAKKPNMAMLYCDIVEPSIVSNQKLQLLHTIPMRITKKHLLYEPKNLIYHPVISRTFTDIGFQLTQPDGSPFDIDNDFTQEEALLYGGLLVSLNFRPQKKQ